MKKILIIAFIFFHLKTAAQEMIYLASGNKVPGEISEITKDSIKFTNEANPDGSVYHFAIAKVRFAFNATGNYLIFNPAAPFTDKEKDEFLAKVFKPRPFNIAVDLSGKLLPFKLKSETDSTITGTDNGKDFTLQKSSLAFTIRRNGNHDIFSTVDKALPFLTKDKLIIDSLLANAPAAVAKIDTSASSPQSEGDARYAQYITPDMAMFGRKALQKTTEFTGYLHTIAAAKTERAAAVKSITLACDLFLNQGINSRVEVANDQSSESNKYLVSNYLNRLMLKSGQFDKVNVEFADINYASKFTKGPDGNYYGTVTFVEKFQGFIDGNLVYGNQTKRNIVIVLKQYEKEVNGEKTTGWDVYLDDIGIMESKPL